MSDRCRTPIEPPCTGRRGHGSHAGERLPEVAGTENTPREYLLALTLAAGYDPVWEKWMASRRRRWDRVGPFGNPDGPGADIEDLISEFVDFGGNPAYGHLATRANDSMVRGIVGKLGAGKTVYLRRLQDFQSNKDSVYADLPQQSLPSTEVVVKACQWFSDRVLVEKWMQIWDRAIMRSLVSYLL